MKTKTMNMNCGYEAKKLQTTHNTAAHNTAKTKLRGARKLELNQWC